MPRAPASQETRSYDGTVIGERFRLGSVPTLLTRTASVAPIGFTRLRSDAAVRANDVPSEDAYAVHVALRPATADLWIDGRHALATTAAPGDTFLFDLTSNPVSELHGGFDVLRFYISQDSLDELSADLGARGRMRLDPHRLGRHDATMFGLAQALMDRVERGNERSTLFVDHIGLAFHAHVTETYAVAPAPAPIAGRLSAQQLRRALDAMRDHLDGDPSIAMLAKECGLSPGYFARAFRRTTGTTPHQWLIRQRVARARELLLRSRLTLADIAAACGFVDQSHFSRVFAKSEGQSPGRWRGSHG